MQKLTALFTTGSGLTLVLLFLGGGISAITGHFTGNIAATLTTIVALIGMITHPTAMIGGKSVN